MMKNKDVRVAATSDNGKIIINVGLADMVDESMEFLVYSEGGEVTDPITKKVLGKLENPKGKFKVFHIQEHFTTLLPLIKRPNNMIRSFAMFADEDSEYAMLRTIQIGDKVKVINRIGNYSE